MEYSNSLLSTWPRAVACLVPLERGRGIYHDCVYQNQPSNTKDNEDISACFLVDFSALKSALSDLGLAKYSQHGSILSLVKRTS